MSQAPQIPEVDKVRTALYRHFDAEGRLLYVGISLSVLARLAQHRDGSPWYDHIANVTVEWLSSRLDALEAERKAIRSEKPLHNAVRYAEKPPKVDRAAMKAAEHAAKAEAALVRQTVLYKPIYTASEAALVLGIGDSDVRHFIQTGELGHVVLGENVYAHARTKVPTLYRKIGVTGWQIIDFVEILEREAATGLRILSERDKGVRISAPFSEPVQSATNQSDRVRA